MGSQWHASLEDYYSDNTMGAMEKDFAQRSRQLKSERCGEKMRQFAGEILGKSADHVAASFGGKINHFTREFISSADFNRALGRIIPPAVVKNGPPPRDPYRDADFVRISELLNLHGKTEWSLRPRTFALLRMIDAVDAIEAFIADRLSDIALPYTEENLPIAVKGAVPRRRFLDLQNLVLSTHAADLEKGGSHMNFPSSADNHFQSLRELGDGGFGQVDHVWSKLSLQSYARKRIPRGRSFKRDQLAIQNFEKELGNLKLLSHRHLVQLIGSYTDPRWVGLIMRPVADMDLAAYLSADVDPRERKTCLRRFYGCLANAVLYLHQQQIRHKDIKPRNILVRGTDVLITDFGTSMHWTDDSRSTTTGTVPASTPRYCPPEVAGSEERRTSSDIWSLGCCFLEMSTVMNGRKIKEMKSFFASNGTQSEFFHANAEATKSWIKLIKETPEDEDDTEPLNKLIPWTMERLAKERPTAQQLVNCILNFESRHAFYGICCSNDDVPAQITRREHLPDNEKTIAEETLRQNSTLLTFEDPKAEADDEGIEQKIIAPLLSTPHNGSRALSPVENSAQDCKLKPEISQVNGCKVLRPVQGPMASPRASISPSRELGIETTAIDPTTPKVSAVSAASPLKETKSKVANARFTLLPEERRPEPAIAPNEDEETFSRPYQYIPPTPLSSPAINTSPAIPKSTRVPSYVLASTNRFTSFEINELVPRSSSSIHAPPLFVYGSFMFPSVINAQASKSMKGIYSRRYQRRLNPNHDDWAHANLSSKHAAEMMTPAVLSGYDRWRPKALRCAAIQRSWRNDQDMTPEQGSRMRSKHASKFPGHVKGFLLLGLSEEALKVCDEVLPLKDYQKSSYRKKLRENKKNSEHDKGLDKDTDLDSDSDVDEKYAGSPFERRKVQVTIELKSGRSMKIEAVTYVWAPPNDPSDIYSLSESWGLNDFVMNPCFTKSLEKYPGDHGWVAEEEALAGTMKTVLVLPGETLAHAVTEQDAEAICALLDDGHDINGVCRLYGTALQTAVVHTNEAMVTLLLEEGADVNKGGGQYRTALIAAIVSGHEDITRALLDHKANVLAEGGRYISPLYQAISHSNEKLVYMLLEAGAWLSTGYDELLDLAAERHNKAIMDMLVEYDVRNVHMELPMYRLGSERPSAKPELALSSSSVIKAVIGQVLVLKGSQGSWQGRKGVQVLKAAMNAGFRLEEGKHLDLLRSHLSSIPNIIDFFRKAMAVMLGMKDRESEDNGVPTVADSASKQVRAIGMDYMKRRP